MTTKRITKIQIAWANRALAETYDYAKELRTTEGNAKANGFLQSRDTLDRCGEALRILRLSALPQPEWLVKNFAYYKAMGWTCLPDGTLRGV
jgi:hypothetical protein